MIDIYALGYVVLIFHMLVGLEGISLMAFCDKSCPGKLAI